MSFELNKILGAVLAAMMLAMISGIVSGILVHPTKLEKPVFAIEGVAAAPAAGGGTAAPVGPEPIGALMASANADNGKAKTQQCAACHTFDKGQPNRVGPNLWGVIGDEIAHDRGGFAFSTALAAKGGEWTVDKLNEWLWKPQNFAKGTKMTFVGLAKPQDRADVIAYLNAESDSPKPLASLGSAPAPTAAPAEAKPAEAAPQGEAKPAN
jgi:cytochrome c